MALAFRPLSAHVGAEVLGLDLHRPLDPATQEALRAGFRDHALLLVRQPDVQPEEQVRFAQTFGEITIRARYKVTPDAPLTQYVSNSRDDGILGQGEIEFHQDHLFYEPPLKALILYAMEVPKSGSATKFRHLEVLADRLTPALRARVAGVRCLHLYNYEGDYTAWQDPAKAPADSPRAWQSLLRTDPETGEQALWVTPTSTVGFDTLSFDEGRALIEELWNFAAGQDDIEYIHHWQPGDLVIWNNRRLQHARLPFNSDEPRTLRRTPIL